MADPKIQAKQIAIAAAKGVAIALSRRGEEKHTYVPPHIVCGYPPFIYEAVLEADADGNLNVKSVTEQRGA
jgi:hypothetical protein